MDIIVLLRKLIITFDNINIIVTGELSKEASVQYVVIYLKIYFKGDAAQKNATVSNIQMAFFSWILVFCNRILKI